MLTAGALGVAALLLTFPFIAALLKWAALPIRFSFHGSSRARK